jgi:O-antigen ligase
LLVLSDSRTAMACLALVAALLVGARLPVVRTRPARVVALAVVAGGAAFAADAAFGLRETVLAWAGRDPTLTHRTGIWRVLLAMPSQPLIGEGYMSFWSGPRLQEIWTALKAPILQAHNGYIEQYLNLGWIGAAFMVALLAVGLTGARRQMQDDPAGGMLKLCCVASAALYNWSEAAFYGMNAMWMLALVGILDTRVLRR